MKHYLSGEWAEYSIEDGVMSYDEILYALAGIFKKATATTPAGFTTARRWVYDINAFAADTVQTYSIETGDTTNNRGGKAVEGAFTEFSFEVSRDGDTAEMGGALISQAIEPQALTGGGIALADFVPIVPSQCEVYLSDTQRSDLAVASRAAFRIPNAFSFGFEIGDRRTPVWLFNRNKRGYSTTVEDAPSFEISLTIADEAAPLDDVLTNLRNGQRVYLLFEAVGDVIEALNPGPGNVNYRFEMEVACQVSDAPDEDEEQSAQVVNLTLAPEYDGDWGKAFEIRVDNLETTL